MINKIFAKIFAITSFFNPLNYISNKSYPNIKEPQVIEPYKSACYGRRPQRQTLQIQRQNAPKLERGRTPSQKRSLCVTALINTPLYPLPPICL